MLAARFFRYPKTKFFYESVKYRTLDCWAGVSTDREQAVEVIKEILQRCRPVEGRSITLLAEKNDGKLPNKVEIRIRTDDVNLKACIERVAEKRNLATRQDENYFTVYNPYPDAK